MKDLFRLFLLFILGLTISSCSVEGEEISGIWYANGDLGKMKIEIKNTSGSFSGYLLEYELNGKLIKGHGDVIFKNLRFKNNQYLGGSFMKSTKGINPCGLRLAFNSEARASLRAAHNCNGENRLEYWYRDKYHDKPALNNNVSTISIDDLLKANPKNKDK